MNLVSKLKNKKSLNIIYENNNINSNSFNYFIPNLNQETLIAFALIFLGALSVVMIEKYSKN